MSKFDVGDLVEVFNSATEEFNGCLGTVADHSWDGKGLFLNFTEVTPESLRSVGGRAFFRYSSLRKATPGRIVGRSIEPKDVRVGDKIETTQTIKDREIIYRGVVDRVSAGRSGFFTASGYLLYSDTWEEYATSEIILLEAAPEKHPLEDTKEGAYFTYHLNGVKFVSRKYIQSGWWIHEAWIDGKLSEVRTQTEEHARRAFDHHKPVLHEPSGN